MFFDVINRSDGLMDLIYELRIISIVFSALAIVFLTLVLFSFVIANYAQVARLQHHKGNFLQIIYSLMHLLYFRTVSTSICKPNASEKKLEEGKMSRTWPTRFYCLSNLKCIKVN